MDGDEEKFLVLAERTITCFEFLLGLFFLLLTCGLLLFFLVTLSEVWQ